MNEINIILKKAKELETTLLRVKELINSIAMSDDIILNISDKEFARTIYESFKQESKDE